MSSYKETLVAKMLHDTLSLSVRCDGSVERTQIDKIVVMAKVVTITGEEEEYFLGAAKPQERGAKGMCAAVQEACTFVVGENQLKTMSKGCFLTCHLLSQMAPAPTLARRVGGFGPSSIACVVVHRWTTVTNVSLL